MKTFTNYAEKKAKQFLYLLQGYTKGIRLTAILILLLMGVNSAWAYNYGGSNVYYYFANTGSWPGVHLYIWNGSWNTDFTLTQIANTKVYYHKWTSAYNGNEGILFRGAANWDNGQTSDIKADYTSHTSWVHNNTTGKTDLSNINRTAQVAVKLSTGGNYTQTANANCVAKVSGYTVVAGNSSATAKNASTSGSSATASISAAYGSTITYTATASTGYTFKGFSTSNSTSLPSSPSASGKTATASGYGSTNNSTYYAYFKANQYTVKFDANGGSGTMSNQSYAYGVSQALTANAFTRIGYTFAGWNTKADGTGTKYTDKQSVSNLSSTDGATITLYAQWTEKTYSLTFKHDGNGTIKVGGTTVNSGGTASVNHVNTKTLVATANTGYIFSGWTLSGNNTSAVTIGNTSASSTTIKATNTGAIVTANFTAKTYAITLNANGGASNGSATATYNSSTITNLTHPTRTDYRCNGYYTAASDGNLVLNIDGTLAKNVSGYTDANGNWTKDGNATLYAQWTYDVTEYTVTFGVGTSSTSYGSLTAYNKTTSASITSPAQVRSQHSVTFTATPKTGYVVEGWYTNAACTTDKHDAGNTTYTTTITAATNVYVKFVEKTWSVAFAAGTGGTVTTPSSTPQTVGQVTGISIAATPATGYTFNQWTITSGSGSFTSAATTNSNTFKPTNNSTVTASFNETMSTLTTSNKYDVGNPEYAIPTKSVNSIGVATTATVKATAAGNGYTFTGWTLTNCTRTDNGATNATSITVRSNGDGKAATVVANYAEDLTSTYYVQGDNAGPFSEGWNANQNTMMKKHSGNANSNDVYWEIDVPQSKVTPNDNQWEFKIYNAAGSDDNKKWLGWGSGGDHYWLTKENNNLTLSTSGSNNIRFKPYLAGKYTFHLNYDDSSKPTLEVTWPVYNQLRISAANPADATNTGEFDMTGSGTYTVTRSLNANTTYTFKIVYDSEWYGASSGKLTRTSSSKTLSTSSNDLTIQTDVAGDYTFTFNSSDKKLDITYPTAYKVTYTSTYTGGTVSATAESNTLHLPNTEITFTATANTGFSFIGWKDGNDQTISTDNPYTHKMVSDITLTTDFVTSNDQVVYLKPTSKWKGDDATFAVHVWNNGGDATAQDIPMTALDCNDEYYQATIPAGFHSVVFYRKSADGIDVWNKTADLVIPTNNNNCYTITSTGSKDPFTAAAGNWGTYTEPKYSVTINAPESGTIKVTIGGVTTTVTSETQTISNVALNAQMDVAFEPATGYELGKAIIEIGNNDEANAAGTYTVCGPTEITAYFVTTDEHVVYLRPTDAWLADNARFAAYAFNRYAGTAVSQWIELTTKDTDYTGAFSGTIPAGFSHIQFVRMPETGNFSFDIDLAQTLNYAIPVDNNNRFKLGNTIASGSDHGKYQGSWEASNTPIYGIPGDWQVTTWAADQYPLMGPDGEVTVNITQTNATLNFKVYHYPYATNNDDQWLGNDNPIVRGNSSNWVMTTTGGNCGLGVDIAGDYIFHFNIRNKQLTVTYPELPTPTPITVTSKRLYDNTELDWFDGEGTEADPYQLYIDEAVRLIVSPLTEVPGLTAYYKLGKNEEQTSNIFDWEDIMFEPAHTTIQAYYKNATGTSTDMVSVETPYCIYINLPFYLMTEPRTEINIDRIKAGENILVQFRSDAAATVGLYLQINDGAETKLTDITNSISKNYTHDVDNNITPCILHYIARSTATVHGRTFEAKADVAIYKNVIIKVNDPDGWVKNAYMWRDYSDAVKTQWPGEPVLQNFGTWRVFSVKYPYYDRFIVNDGKAEGATQTIDYVLPADDTCYELLTPANNGSDKAEDKGKYGLKVADCPGNLIVSNIKDTTIMEGEQIVVMPEIFVGLGYKLSDVRITQLIANNPSSVRADISSTNIVVRGYGIGESNVDVTYTLGNETITKTFKVTVVKNTNITIQVKVPDFGDGAEYQWKDGTKIGIRYWGEGINGTDLLMDYAYKDNTYTYAQAQIPLGTDGTINFHFYYERHGDDNAKWRQSLNIEKVSTSGCYKLKQGNDYYRHWERDGEYCYDDTNYAQYQVKVFLPMAGKEYSSNIVTNTTDIMSFFAPGEEETGYRAGTIQLYKNGKMVAAIAPSTFAESNVYVATVNETGNGLENVAPYTGNYYIRTYGTSYKNVGFNNGKGWNSIKDLTAVEKDSVRFTYFIPREGEFYNHYWVQAMNTGEQFEGKDVSACVANEYNDDLAGKLTKGKGTDDIGDIKVGTNKVINVRFGYDPRTNYFGRAIIQGSEYNDYLNIHCDNAYKDKNCSTKLPYGTSGLDNKMQDISNWVYQRDFYVPITNSYPSASLYVEAKLPSNNPNTKVYDHLLGYVINEVTGEEDHTKPVQRTVIGSGTNNGTYLMRVVYDFKTNRIIAAWLPQGTIEVTDDRTLHADVLFVRQENNEVPQIQLANDGKIRSLESMYFALELERGDENAANRHEEQYFFTLPFNSIVGSISGVPGYMQTWGIQRYRGDLRAQKGWFIETPTFWEWMSLTDTLYAGEGYLLVFDKKAAQWEEIEVDKYDAEGHITGEKEKISMMRLYFPSTTVGFDMQQQSEEHLTRTYENHTCTITREDRDKQDSNWKVIGTTSYNNAGIASYTKDTDPEYTEMEGGEAPKFRYTYSYTFDGNNNRTSYEYTPELGFGNGVTYKSFFGYMVQFAGTINWQPIMSETVPEGIAARRYVPANERTSFTTRLELANADGEKQDQTFVALDEKATITFDQNKDLNKVMNSNKANIYTLSEDIPFAGNTLPMEKATVPVGVRIATAGEYTFRMPDGTDGIAVTLVDNATGTHTNMLMDEYTVTLDAGTIENRFYLMVDPDRTATSVENIGEEAKGEAAKGVEKFLIDGKLFIRTADGIFDAKGQRM